MERSRGNGSRLERTLAWALREGRSSLRFPPATEATVSPLALPRSPERVLSGITHLLAPLAAVPEALPPGLALDRSLRRCLSLVAARELYLSGEITADDDAGRSLQRVLDAIPQATAQGFLVQPPRPWRAMPATTRPYPAARVDPLDLPYPGACRIVDVVHLVGAASTLPRRLPDDVLIGWRLPVRERTVLVAAASLRGEARRLLCAAMARRRSRVRRRPSEALHPPLTVPFLVALFRAARNREVGRPGGGRREVGRPGGGRRGVRYMTESPPLEGDRMAPEDRKLEAGGCKLGY